MGTRKRGGFAGYGSNPFDARDELEVIDGPASSGPDEVRSEIFGKEPYVRVRIPGRPVFDAKVRRWSRTHVLLYWEADLQARGAWVPAGYVRRIAREDSSWRDPYDRHD